MSPVTDGNGDPQRRPPSNADLYSTLEAIRTENREARHSQNNTLMAAIASASRDIRTDLQNESKEQRDILAAIEVRVRTLEQQTPSSLGGRLGETEKWMAVYQAANLPSRVDVIESNFDQMRGSLNLLKYLQVLVSFAVGAITLIGFVLIQRPA